MKKIIVVFLLVLFGYLTQASVDKGAISGKEVIQKMHDRYHDTWYPYLTFKQNTIFYKNGEVSREQVWYEALAAPGRLIIKFDSLNSGTGIIFRQDSQYVFQNNQLIRKMPRVHDLLVLGFDVYAQKPGETVKKLKKNGFDMDKSYETDWQGRLVYVVGAENENDMSAQFWIDKEHLYFVRLLRQNKENGIVQETQFNKYERIAGGWVAPEVLFFNNNQLVLKEEYSNIKAPEILSNGIFDLEDFKSATW